jgi:GT2 family glycosyltransferase
MPAKPAEAVRSGRARVLVIVVHWRNRELTERCLESLARGTYPAADLLLVDNASSDHPGAELRAKLPGVEVLELESNRLYAGGVNRGLERAYSRGYDYAVMMNNDVEAAPDLIECLVEAAGSDPRIGLVGPKIYYQRAERQHPDSDIRAAARDRIWSAGGRIDWWSGMSHHRGLRQPDGPEWDTPADVDYLTGACILITHRVLSEVGYLDEDYVMYAEDADYCVRARAQGFRVVYAPRARLWHEVSAASGGGLTAYKMYHRVRSNLRFLRRHARPWHWLTIVLLLPLHFLVFAARELVRGKLKIVRAAVAALVDLARGAPRRAA